jgi:selenide,water dikinase
MLENENISAEIDSECVPYINGTESLVNANVIPGGTIRNLSYLEKWVEWDKKISHFKKIILADAQTSGGLLISTDNTTAMKLVDEMHDNGVEYAKIIGKVCKKRKKLIKII